MASPMREIRIGVGGWVFAPWRESFYPRGMRPAEFLSYASRQLTSIEVNATFYRTQTPATFKTWRDATPDGFVFALKGPRAATQPRDAARASVAIERFLSSGISELGDKLGPIAWQFPPARRFEATELAGFLALLPADRNGLRLRHAVEAAHESFKGAACVALLRAHGVAQVLLGDGEPEDTGDFIYARLKGTVAEEETGFSAAALDAWAERLRRWRERRDCFVYVISGAKARNPAAARELLRRIGSPFGPAPSGQPSPK